MDPFVALHDPGHLVLARLLGSLVASRYAKAE